MMRISVLSLCILIVGIPPLGAQHYFEINDFQADQKRLTLVEQARVEGQQLVLSPERPQARGACWYSLDRIDLARGFETEFTFLIDKTGSQEHGDGFAFIMQNQSPDQIGAAGPALGYEGIRQAVALEFDTYDNNEGSKNHVNLSIWSPTERSFKRVATVHEIPEITDGAAHYARIEYQDGFLSFYLDSYLFPILSTKIDLVQETASADGKAWLGFTAASSEHQSRHRLLYWKLAEKVTAPESIDVKNIAVTTAHTIEVKSRKLRIKVWDDHRVDGDIISLKYGDDWLLSEFKLTKKPKVLTVTLTGFYQDLILYANNVGLMPPNTAAISVYDGKDTHRLVLNADLKSSESIRIRYSGE